MFLLIVSLLISSSVLSADVLDLIDFQGRLSDDSYNPINGTVPITFSFYSAPDALEAQWSETHSVDVNEGLFHVTLGTITPLTEDVFDSSERWIGLTVGSDSEMSPRTRIASVPYALQSRTSTPDEDWTIDGNDMYSNNLGNIGIGITNPTEAKLEIGTSSYSGIKIDSCGEHGIHIKNSTNNGFYIEETGTTGYGFRVTNSGSDAYNAYLVGNPTAWTTSSFSDGVEICGTEGHGLFVGHADNNGVHINSTTNNGVHIHSADEDGIYVYSAGNPSSQSSSTEKNGFEVAGAEGNGLYIGQADGHGIKINSSAHNGLYVLNAQSDGVYILDVVDDGVVVNNANNDGIVITNADDDGIYVTSSGNIGVYSNTRATWGFNTSDAVWSYGGYFPSRNGTICKNVGKETIEKGDVVCISGGYEEVTLNSGEKVSVVYITKSNGNNSYAILGVAHSNAYVYENKEIMDDGNIEIQKSFRFTQENILHNDYLSIIVFGIATVKVESSENIKAGETLTSGNGCARRVNTKNIEGLLLSENVGILGKALEDSASKDKIKVFVNCK